MTKERLLELKRDNLEPMHDEEFQSICDLALKGLAAEKLRDSLLNVEIESSEGRVANIAYNARLVFDKEVGE